jgi:transposase
VRPVIKLIATQTIHCPPAPRGVIEGSRADVSFCAGLLVDKFVYHQPLYRQHQKLDHNGIRASRPWLTQIAKACIALLEPIYASQFDSIRASRVIAMDETAIKAGHDKGKMKAAYFWPVYGDRDEVCFAFFTSRAHQCVVDALGVSPATGAVLLSDGYAAYASYAKKTGLTHAQCWAHTRREFFEAQAADPDAVAAALQQIGQIYANEKHIREHKLSGQAKRDYRLDHSKPVLEVFFDWIEHQFQRQGLLPSNPFTKALAYARERRAGLEVFLTDPEVPVDTNHLERALRVIPMGRKNWLFCWTELGAKQVGIVQSLISTCRLHSVDPYTYLVDVLQRVGQHPASRVSELTPRLWKQNFGENPLRSDLHTLAAQ